MSSRGSHISINELSHRFGFRTPYVLDGINLVIEPGQQVALLGRSGCGKSTLLQLISGMLRPSAGEVRIDGSRVTGPSSKWNVMFQSPSLFPWMNVERNASLGMLLSGDRRLVNSRVPGLLDLVGLRNFASANVRQLSGGQKQRVALARSLATQPELLMLDEPFAALDEMTRESLQRDVGRIVKQLEITLVVVTHDIDEAINMSDRILVMSANPGRIVADLDTRSDREHLKNRIRSAFGVTERMAGSTSNLTMHSVF